MSPQVSVVVPCFNLGRYVDEAVQSCLEQSHPDVEIIVVDDGSTERETSALLASYVRPHTRVVRTTNNGLAAARNHGASLASGQYLCFLDADDWLAPSYFEKAVSTFKSQSELSFVGSWVQATGEEDWLYTPDQCDLPALLADCTVSTAAVVRREAFWSVGGFDTGMPAQGDEDRDLWINLAAHGHFGTILPEALFFYRRRSGSMVEQAYFGDDHLSLAEYMFHKYQDHYDSTGQL